MRRLGVFWVIIIAGCATLPGTQTDQLDANSFGAYMADRVVDFYSEDNGRFIYRGTERHLANGRTVLIQEGCFNGSWERVGRQICYTYPDLLTRARHCYLLEAPLSSEGFVTLRNGTDAFELRQSGRSVPDACPR